MKRHLFLAICTLSTILASASVIWTENFNYTLGDLEGQGGWLLTSKTGDDYTIDPQPQVVDVDLNFPCYGGSVTSGKSVQYQSPTSNGRISYTQFTGSSYKTGTYYVAFLLNAHTVTTTVRDFISFEGGTGSNQRGKLWIRKDATNSTYKLLATYNAQPETTSDGWITGLQIDKTYLVVMKYEFIEGATNDEVTLFVDFPIGSVENATEVQAHSMKAICGQGLDASAAEFSQIKGIAIRQRTSTPDMKIGHIRVATTWEEAIDYQLPGVLIDENFNAGKPGSPWVISSNVGTSNNSHNNDGGKSLKFQYTAEGPNTFTVTTPAVNTADELVFWLKRSANATQVESVVVEKVVGTNPAEVLATYQNSDILSTDWKEFVIPVHELSSNVKFVITVTMAEPTSGTPFLMLDDMYLNSLEAVEIWDNQDNTAILTANKSKSGAEKTVNVLMHRNLVAGTFNTICLPFKLNDLTEIKSYFGEGVALKRLNNVAERQDGGFDLTFANATTMAAGQPFLIQPAEDITTPILFRNVQITKTSNADVTGNYQPTGEGAGADLVKFYGVINPKVFAAEDQNTLILGAENTLYYVTSGTMNGMRGYFHVEGSTAPVASRFRVIMQPEVVTATDLVEENANVEKRILNGRIVIIRDGKMYNVQGQLVK